MEMVLCLYQTRVVYSLCEFERERIFVCIYILFSHIFRQSSFGCTLICKFLSVKCVFEPSVIRGTKYRNNKRGTQESSGSIKIVHLILSEITRKRKKKEIKIKSLFQRILVLCVDIYNKSCLQGIYLLGGVFISFKGV